MTDPVRKSASNADTSDTEASVVLPEGPEPRAIASAPRSGVNVDAGFPEAATETIAALLHLIKLMGGELVLNVAGGEMERFERAVRSKINQYASPTANPTARKSGLAFASHLVEQVLTQLRAQAEVKRSLGKSQSAPRLETRTENIGTASNVPKFLN